MIHLLGRGGFGQVFCSKDSSSNPAEVHTQFLLPNFVRNEWK